MIRSGCEKLLSEFLFGRAGHPRRKALCSMWAFSPEMAIPLGLSRRLLLFRLTRIGPLSGPQMTEDSSPSRFKADMPQIPGVPSSSSRTRSNPLLPLIAGVIVIGVVLLLAARWLGRPRPVAAPSHVEPTPQLEVPPPTPDPASLLPHADPDHPVIASLAELSKPWSSADFFIRDFTTGENVPATIVRLPSSSPSAVASYWAFSRQAPYGTCQLEFIRDLDKLRTEYEYRAANHPLVGNPCSHTLYDPLKTTNLPGNIWIRGAIVQGSDVRPPIGVELKIRDKQILAIRTE